MGVDNGAGEDSLACPCPLQYTPLRINTMLFGSMSIYHGWHDMKRFPHLTILVVAFLCACAPDPLEPLPVGPADGWRVFHPLPGGYNLYSVWAAGTGDTWAVGAFGVIVHWDGETVRRVDSPTRAWLTALDGFGRDRIYAGGDDVVLRFDGHAWSVLARFPDHDITDLLCADDGLLYVAGDFGVRTYDGRSWRTLLGPTAMAECVWTGKDGLVRIGDGERLWVVNEGEAIVEWELEGGHLVLGDGGYFIVQHDGIKSLFTHIADEGWVHFEDYVFSIEDILDTGSATLMTMNSVSRNGELLWSNDSGRWLYALGLGADGRTLACGYGGTLMSGAEQDGEWEWTDTAESLGYRHFNAFDGRGCDDIWAAEYWGRVCHFDGESWTVEYTPLPSSYSVSMIQALADGSVVAKGGSQIAVRTPEGGWTRLPDHGDHTYYFHALAADSVFVGSPGFFRLWDGEEWRIAGTADDDWGVVWGIDSTPSGRLFGLVNTSPAGDMILLEWNGETFEEVLRLDAFSGSELHASRSSETLWIGGEYSEGPRRTTILRYRDGELVDQTGDADLPMPLFTMTELRDDDVFVLGNHEVWRLSHGSWSRETGLPTDEDFEAIWSHPDCGVFVEGHPTFFKEF